MSNDMPPQWAQRAERADLPATYRGIAAKTGLGVETVRQAILGTNGRRPSPHTIRTLALAFLVPDDVMDSWCGYHGTVGDLEPYTGPADSARLTPRQRAALDRLILSIVEPEKRARPDMPSYTSTHHLPAALADFGEPAGKDGLAHVYDLAANRNEDEAPGEEESSPEK